MQIPMSKARSQFADILNRAAYGGERVILERRGKGVAAVVSMEDLENLIALEDEADLKAALRARKQEGRIPLADVKARLGMK